MQYKLVLNTIKFNDKLTHPEHGCKNNTHLLSQNISNYLTVRYCNTEYRSNITIKYTQNISIKKK